MDISVVIPVFGCKEALNELHQRLVATLSPVAPNFEIIFVNDGCPYGSWETILNIAREDHRVKGIDLSRNFGQIRAITAGLHHAKGDWVVVMDCDLQDAPEEIPKLLKAAHNGYDVVFSRRIERQDSFFKRMCSNIFYKIYGYFTNGVFDSTISNFSVCRKPVVENYLLIKDQNRAFVLFIKWMGFKSTTVDVEHCKRANGKSSYNLKKQLKLAFDIIITQSNKPLTLSIQVGFTIALLAFLFGVYFSIRYFIQGKNVSGWTSTIVSIYFVAGIILVKLGVLGLYIGSVFDQTKNRPLFITREIFQKSE